MYLNLAQFLGLLLIALYIFVVCIACAYIFFIRDLNHPSNYYQRENAQILTEEFHLQLDPLPPPPAPAPPPAPQVPVLDPSNGKIPRKYQLHYRSPVFYVLLLEPAIRAWSMGLRLDTIKVWYALQTKVKCFSSIVNFCVPLCQIFDSTISCNYLKELERFQKLKILPGYLRKIQSG